MSARSIFNTIMNVSGIIRDLETLGMRVEVGDDFSQYRAYRAAQTDRSPPYAMFDSASSFVDSTNGFWVCGFDDAGDLIHTQAARLFDLGDMSLGRHMDLHRLKYITPDTTPDPDATFYSGPRALDIVTGKICYHGDFWLPSRGLGGPRSQGATSLLSRVLFEVMCQNWNPDYVFALVPKQLAAKGAHLRYGYTHCEPGKWIGPDNLITEEDYMIWMSAKDLTNALSEKMQPSAQQDPIPALRPSVTSIDTKG